MPAPPAKLRLLLLLPIIPALLAIAILVMLVADHPIRFVNRASLQLSYAGGRILLTCVHANDATGPSADVSSGLHDSYYMYFDQMTVWKNALPRRAVNLLGVSYESVPKVQYGPTFFTADRVRTLGVNVEYLLFIAALLLL